MKNNGLLDMIILCAAYIGMAIFFFITGLWEAGIASIIFFLLFSLGTIGEIFQDHTEKK